MSSMSSSERLMHLVGWFIWIISDAQKEQKFRTGL